MNYLKKNLRNLRKKNDQKKINQKCKKNWQIFNKLFKKTKNYLDILNEIPYIFNLGHGLLPETDPDKVSKLIEFYREY